MQIVRMLFGALFAQQFHSARREPQQEPIRSAHGEEYGGECVAWSFQYKWTEESARSLVSRLDGCR